MTWTQTYTGRAFDLLHPSAGDVCIEDIAHSLAYQCRFNGHTKRFYSVAEHCIHISRFVPAEVAAWGLLHDADEAYVSDVPLPLKQFLSEFKTIENRVARVIAERFGLTWPMPAVIKSFDTRILMDERHHLLAVPPRPWANELEPLGIVNMGMMPQWAEQAFLERFYELGLS
jgi:hypothetical protein